MNQTIATMKMKIRNYITPFVFFIALQFASAQTDLMKANMDNSLETVWQNKEIFNTKTIDNCENLENWESGGEAKISLCNTRIKEGGNSIKFSTPVVSADSSAMYPISYLERKFSADNWESFNRVSVWIYVENTNAEYIYLSMDFKNDGLEKVPNNYKKKGRNFFKVETNKWNRVLWEIPFLPRDEVTSLAFVYTINGKHFTGVGDRIDIYIDKIELQNVNADYEEGWHVAPKKIAFSHTGYSSKSSKSALANNLNADEFSIVDAISGEKVLTKKIENISSRFGSFQLMDFSELRTEGEYKIQTGDITTRSFKISNSVWTESIWKNLNFWRTERCGQEVQGIHENCHRDVWVEHNGKKIIINGGWHDAGDLTQMVYNTGDAIYAMLDLAAKAENKNSELYSALVEEAKWGLEWMLKTRFGKGYRQNFGGISKYTDGIIGTGDDISFEAKNQPYENFLSAMAISKAALFFNENDQTLSDECKNAAIEDWEYATKKITKLNVELCGNATIASVFLFKLTGDSLYYNKAIEWADVLINSQQQTIPDWDIPLIGFFYKDPDKKQVLRYNPIGQDQAPILALASLCELFPHHKKWIDWYATIALYAEYIKTTAELSNPYHMIPQSIYNVEEVHTPSIYGLQQSTLAKYKKYEEQEPQYVEQVKSGLPLGKGNYLRTFPVWYAHRGSAGIQMAQAKGLAVASHLRNDMDGLNLAEKQLQWVAGYNPFAQSTMYGEGYDFAPFYFVSSGPIVGSIACGIQTNGNSDIPNWPASNCYNYKEIWTHTANRWLMLVSEIYDTEPKNASLLNDKDLDFSISKKLLRNGKIEISVSAVGNSEVYFELRGFNLETGQANKKVKFDQNQKETINWKVKPASSNRPWIAVVIANNDMSTKKEIYFEK